MKTVVSPYNMGKGLLEVDNVVLSLLYFQLQLLNYLVDELLSDWEGFLDLFDFFCGYDELRSYVIDVRPVLGNVILHVLADQPAIFEAV